MSKSVKFIIELDYNLEDLQFMLGRPVSEETFLEEAEEQAVYDLMDLMRSNSISDFAKVVESD
jgi:hypothetical protein